ncbi:molecular chaperone [Halomonas huangheensis]|uniref:Pili assembly chaperone N-terminal domain-containing protein n=1 Tax=Halomonas huangheensis TaxID=1178482 RepID=W1N1I1_9GAMM|nr:fimbria/pilus periplasmic chaperone [Halomonas huangheensis]ALM52398.1 hypothetical protein AR456_08985 [Halomonas huangheensis]ERL49344.1 hypothetical protein BJB45_07690 [Halomonas huangheensis]
MTFHWVKTAFLALGLSVLVTGQSQAAVTISGSRVIYPAEQQHVGIELSNSSGTPVLVQSWLDSGDATLQPGEEALPFVITPPVARVEAHAGQTLRLAYIGHNLPQDRESLFWLNVLEIPPKATSSEDLNTLQVALRTRIKVLFRPEGLQGSLSQAAEGLQWRWGSMTPGGQELIAENVSPYYVNLANLQVTWSGGSNSVEAAPVPPMGQQVFVVKNLQSSPSGANISGDWINDYGATTAIRYPL